MNISIDDNILRSILKDVYFVSGTAYAGKSTMVQLLADKYGGICCGENYHMEMICHADPIHQPNLCYFDTMSDWYAFISRTPEAYDAWITGSAQEAAQLEIIKLLQLVPQNKKIFVDTNIPLELLKRIAGYRNVAIMLSPQSMSVERFFDRPDQEKQFLLQQIQSAPDPQWALDNFKACIARINSPEYYREFADSGFYTHIRGENCSIEETLAELEAHFLLTE